MLFFETSFYLRQIVDYKRYASEVSKFSSAQNHLLKFKSNENVTERKQDESRNFFKLRELNASKI